MTKITTLKSQTKENIFYTEMCVSSLEQMESQNDGKSEFRSI